MEQVNSDRFENVLQNGGAVLVDFYSESCVPCKRMAPVLSELENELGADVSTVKINVAEEGGLARKYSVQAVPTFIMFRNGSERSRLVGAVPKSELADFIKKNQ